MGRTEVVVDILVNSRDAAREMDRTASQFDSFGGTMESLAAPAGVALAAIGGLATGAAKAASDMQQSSGGVDAVFKTSAGVVHDWAKTSAQDVGLASSEYQTMAAGIGGALSGMGVPLDQAAQSTHDLMLRAADLASVYGGTTQQAAEAVTSAFRGEYDSLQRLIPSMSAAKVQAEMQAEASQGMTFASEDAAKAAAITNLIMKESSDAAGNFAKEADTAAGAQARAKSEFINTAAALGKELLPVITTLMEWLAKLGQWVSEHIPLVTALGVVIGGLAAAVLAVNAAMAVAAAAEAVATAATAAWSAAAGIGTIATTAFGVAMSILTSPITLVVVAVAALIAIIVLLVKNWDTVSAAAVACWDAITSAVGTAVEFIKSTAGAVLDWLAAAWGKFGDWVAGVWSSISDKAGIAWEIVKTVALAPLLAIQYGLEALKTAALAVWEAIRSTGSAIWGVIQRAAESALRMIMTPIQAVQRAIETVINKIKDAINWATNLARKIPVIGGIFGSSAAAVSGTSVRSIYAAPSVAGLAPGSHRSSTATGGGGIVINVSGALDPVAVARQITDILQSQARRVGGVRV